MSELNFNDWFNTSYELNGVINPITVKDCQMKDGQSCYKIIYPDGKSIVLQYHLVDTTWYDVDKGKTQESEIIGKLIENQME